MDFLPGFPGFQNLTNFLLKSVNIGSKIFPYWDKKTENISLSGN
jgi:hypothetical protein